MACDGTEAFTVKKAAALILALMTALSLTGCASVFDKEYFSSAEYDPPAEDTQYDGATEISSYMQLTLAINNLVSEHGDSVLLRFTGTYDGDIGEDRTLPRGEQWHRAWRVCGGLHKL